MDLEFLQNYLDETLVLAIEASRDVMNPTIAQATATRQAYFAFSNRERHVRKALQAVVPELAHKLVRFNDGSYLWPDVIDALSKAVYAVTEGLTVDEALIDHDESPSLDADFLHTTIWDAAKSYWRSEHYRAAVHNAAGALDAAVQHKLGRRDLSGTKLMAQAFSLDQARPGHARLRLAFGDTSQSADSLRQGALLYAQGVYMAIRNPAAHDTDELEPHIALEHLAVLSVLARWVDDAHLASGYKDPAPTADPEASP